MRQAYISPYINLTHRRAHGSRARQPLHCSSGRRSLPCAIVRAPEGHAVGSPLSSWPRTRGRGPRHARGQLGERQWSRVGDRSQGDALQDMAIRPLARSSPKRSASTCSTCSARPARWSSPRTRPRRIRRGRRGADVEGRIAETEIDKTDSDHDCELLGAPGEAVGWRRSAQGRRGHRGRAQGEEAPHRAVPVVEHRQGSHRQAGGVTLLRAQLKVLDVAEGLGPDEENRARLVAHALRGAPQADRRECGFEGRCGGRAGARPRHAERGPQRGHRRLRGPREGRHRRRQGGHPVRAAGRPSQGAVPDY